MTVRVRVAPSPTGNLHVGTARAALYNWLYARHTGGTFVVRVDDTDVARSTADFEANILDSLRWLGLDWDEGVGVGGPHGTYRQSARFQRYAEVAAHLVGRGLAYVDDRTIEELDALRDRARGEGRHPGFYIRRPDRAASEGVIRFSVEPGPPVEVDDVVRGRVAFERDAVDDFIILRSDGTPTYHLASSVDDVDYQISHVARGEDILSSTPKHVLLTEALEAPVPTYAHLPLLHGTDGKKLSKRHGATSVEEFRTQGFLPEAMVNYLCLLGWSPGDDLTVFDLELAVARFDLSDVQRNPAVFDLDKLTWINGEYIRAMDPARFAELVRPHVASSVGELDGERWTAFERLAPHVQERTKLLPEAASQATFLFVDEVAYDDDSWRKVMTKEGVGEVLDAAEDALGGLQEWSTTQIETALRALPERLDRGAGKVFQPIRVAVTGSSVSPPLFESLEALGSERSLARITDARARL